MTEWLIALLASYGTPLLFLITFLSCLAVPVPSSLMMLSGGAFVATGDLTLIQVAGAAFAGAISGDQAGYHLGKRGQSRIDYVLKTHPARQKLLARARHMITRWGGPGVFLSRWLFSPLGPYVNFAGGASGLHWLKFTVWAAMGEAVWVTIYIGLGWGFADDLAMAADLASNTIGLLAAITVTFGLGAWLYIHARHKPPLEADN